jgi:hypothetical protein
MLRTEREREGKQTTDLYNVRNRRRDIKKINN